MDLVGYRGDFASVIKKENGIMGILTKEGLSEGMLARALEERPELADAVGKALAEDVWAKGAERDPNTPEFSLVIIDKEKGDVYTFAEWETTDLIGDWVSAHVLAVQTSVGHNNLECKFTMN